MTIIELVQPPELVCSRKCHDPKVFKTDFSSIPPPISMHDAKCSTSKEIIYLHCFIVHEKLWCPRFSMVYKYYLLSVVAVGQILKKNLVFALAQLSLLMVLLVQNL
jgi:hypothetical protein